MKRVPSGVNLGELLGAAALVGLGAFALIEGGSYRMGTLVRMGPGYFPIILGGLLIGLGLVIGAQSWKRPPRAPAGGLRAALGVVAGVVAFGLLVSRAGIVPATLALVAACAVGKGRLRPVATVLVGLALSAFAVLVFIRGFGMSLRAFWWG